MANGDAHHDRKPSPPRRTRNVLAVVGAGRADETADNLLRAAEHVDGCPRGRSRIRGSEGSMTSELIEQTFRTVSRRLPLRRSHPPCSLRPHMRTDAAPVPTY
jgi:hypothetical protein